jgi:chromosomal replication initiation ATPase DnaA
MTSNDIIRDVVVNFGITVEQLLGSCREPKLCAARRAAAKRMRELGHSYPRIGRRLNRTETTVAYYCDITLSERRQRYMRARYQQKKAGNA